jgi:hypothetical protein
MILIGWVDLADRSEVDRLGLGSGLLLYVKVNILLVHEEFGLKRQRIKF